MDARWFAIAALALLPAGLQAGKDKSTAAPGMAANASVSITATPYTDPASIKQLVGSDFNGYYTVVEVTVTPKTGKVTVQRDDFTLKTDKDGERTQPMAPSQIAGRTDLTLRETRTGTGTVGTQPTGPVWSGLPLPGGGQSMGNGAGGGGATKTGVVNTKAAGKADPMLEILKQKMLPEKETDQPASGLLFFNLQKQKLKDLELIYTTAEGPLKLRFR